MEKEAKAFSDQRSQGKGVDGVNLKEVTVFQKEKESSGPEATPWKTPTPAPDTEIGVCMIENTSST